MRGPSSTGLLTNRIPPAGRIALAPMLNEQGRLIGDFTVAALPGSGPAGDRAEDGAEHFVVFGSGVAERYHQRWFDAQRRRMAESVPAQPGTGIAGLSIAGPAVA